MASNQITHRQAWRRTDNHSPGDPKVQLVTEPLPSTLDSTSVLIRVHAISLNYRDANIAHGGNPWPVIPHGILGNDASGQVMAVGDKVTELKVRDCVAPIIDTKQITGREAGRSWLAADEDGVMANFVIFDQSMLVKLPEHLSWVAAATIPCAGTTAWSAIKGVGLGQTVLIQGKSSIHRGPLYISRAN